MRSLLLPILLLTGTTAVLAAVSEETPRDPLLPPADEPKKPAPVPAAGSRGQLLYENHCQGCHTSRLHIREHRRARTVDELRGWVTRWAATQKLNWGDEEIRDVTDHLNRRYYRLAPPVRKN
jgi:mono/diheme cytochrome c family protein